MTPKGSTPRVLRFVSLLLRAALCAELVSVTPLGGLGGGAHIRVKGVARIDAHAGLAGGKLVVSGTVTDDEGRPAAGADVSLGLTRGLPGGPSAPLGSARPEGCTEANKPPALDGSERIVLPGDASGRFCVRLTLPKDRYTADLEVRATGSLDGTRLEMPLDLALRPATLRFDPERPVLDLDDDTLDIEVVASTEEDGVTAPAAALWLGLSTETGAMLGGAMTGSSGHARFSIPTARLGPPGRGELRATFAGNGDWGPTAHAIPVERRTRVDLLVPDLNGGRRPIGTPEDGIAIPVVATAHCTRSGCGAIPTGIVEARVGDAVVGAATLDRGAARVLVTFAMTDPTDVSVRLRYGPDTPWFRAAGETTLIQPLEGPSAWRRWPLALAGVAAIGWLVIVRIPRQRVRPASPPSKLRTSRRGPVLEVVGETTSRGWTGHVIDADERTPVVHARVSIERPGFERREVVACTTTDDQGKFVLEPTDPLPGDELSAEAPLHALLRSPLPASGDLRIALVLRRRALLDRLVSWAHRRGKPFDLYADPTPAQLRRAAGADLGVVRWATAVERAAYGGGVVDEQAQGEVDRLAPSELAEEIAPHAREEVSLPRPKHPRR